jgi:hypothetical protein
MSEQRWIAVDAEYFECLAAYLDAPTPSKRAPLRQRANEIVEARYRDKQLIQSGFGGVLQAMTHGLQAVIDNMPELVAALRKSQIEEKANKGLRKACESIDRQHELLKKQIEEKGE